MSQITLRQARIAGITGVVPGNRTDIYEIGKPYFDEEFIDRIHNTVGTKTLYFTDENQSSGDLGVAAAKRLLQEMDWTPESVGALIFNSQTLDFVVPITSAKIQYEIGLTNETFVVDTNYGCSGFPSGLMLSYQMIETGLTDRVILIDSECHHKCISRSDESTALIFGDGAAAIAIERADTASDSVFLSYVDGSHVNDLGLKSFKALENEKILDAEHTFMDGEIVTTYMLKKIPKFCRELLNAAQVDTADIGLVLMHQANAYMVRYLTKRLKLDPAIVPINIGSFGNTSGPSIPLLICEKCGDLFGQSKKKALIVGFGSGFVISGAVLDIGDLRGGSIDVLAE
jgi:3-oxoacyl-[acyl-carrier-protein] synthase-3